MITIEQPALYGCSIKNMINQGKCSNGRVIKEGKRQKVMEDG